MARHYSYYKAVPTNQITHVSHHLDLNLSSVLDPNVCICGFFPPRSLRNEFADQYLALTTRHIACRSMPEGSHDPNSRAQDPLKRNAWRIFLRSFPPPSFRHPLRAPFIGPSTIPLSSKYCLLLSVKFWADLKSSARFSASQPTPPGPGAAIVLYAQVSSYCIELQRQ